MGKETLKGESWPAVTEEPMKLMTIFLCFAPGMFYCSQHIYHQQQQ
jgi:hypothetical protein